MIGVFRGIYKGASRRLARAREDAFIQPECGRLRFYIQFPAQNILAPAKLFHGEMPLPEGGMKPHQAAVGRLAARIGSHQLPISLDCLPGIGRCLANLGQPQEERFFLGPQLFAPHCGPVFIEVLRQQFAPVDR